MWVLKLKIIQYATADGEGKLKQKLLVLPQNVSGSHHFQQLVVGNPCQNESRKCTQKRTLSLSLLFQEHSTASAVPPYIHSLKDCLGNQSEVEIVWRWL